MAKKIIRNTEYDFDFANSNDHFLSEEFETIEDFETSHLEHYFSSTVYTRLKMSYDYTKKYYSLIRNEFRKYKGFTYKSLNTGDIYLYKDKMISRVVIYASFVRVYLSESELMDFTECNVNDLVSFIDIKNDKTFKIFVKTLDLLNVSNMFKYDINEFNFIDYERDALTNSNEILKLMGCSDLIKKKATLEDTYKLNDNYAKNAIVHLTNPFKRKGKKDVYEVSVGELSFGFKGKYDIDLFILKEVKMASSNHNYLKVIPLGECKFQLTVFVDEIDLVSAKMIMLSGGSVFKYLK